MFMNCGPRRERELTRLAGGGAWRTAHDPPGKERGDGNTEFSLDRRPLGHKVLEKGRKVVSGLDFGEEDAGRRSVRDPFDPPKKIWENWDEPFPHGNGKKRVTSTARPEAPRTIPPALEVPDPSHSGYLKDIGGVNVGFGVGVGVPGNDPVNVGARVGVGLGESGLAGGVPIGQNIFPRRGEQHSLNDYDGNKQLILPDKASKYIQAVREGRIRLLKYQQSKTLVGVNGGIGIGG